MVTWRKELVHDKRPVYGEFTLAEDGFWKQIADLFLARGFAN